MTELFNKLAFNKNNGNLSVFSKNDNNKPAFERNDSNNKVNRFGVNKNGVEHAKKSGKLSKSGKAKSKKIFKSQNLAKSRKKSLKSRSFTNFDATEARPKFLTFDTRITFNRLWLAFTKALILQYFNLKCHI